MSGMRRTYLNHWFWRAVVAVGAASVYGMMIFLLHEEWAILEYIKAMTRWLAGYGNTGIWGGGVLIFIVVLVIPNILVLGTYGFLTLRYGDPPVGLESRCRNCGYILQGITEPRCPECGERI